MTVNLSGSGNAAATVSEYSNVLSASAVEATNTASGTSGPFTSSVVTLTANDLVVAASGWLPGTATVSTYPNSWSHPAVDLASSAGSNDIRLSSVYRVAATTGSYSAVWSTSPVSTGYSGTIVALKPGAAPTDSTPPTVPTGLSVTAASSTQLNLAWTASTDANGVQGYRVYRGGSLVATVGGNSYWDTGLTRSTPYSYTVAAIDGTGNASAQGTAAGGTTQDPPTKTTGYTYDFTDRLTSINATGIFTLSTFAFDALDRHRTKSIGGSTVATYSYAGTGGAVVRIAGTSVTTDSAVDASGSRLATKTSTSLFGWTLPDLHGDVAGAISSTGSTITDAFRYDAYGETIDKATSSLPTPWRYQGRLLENETGDTDLYDFGFRSYVVDFGAFNSLDDEAGSAQNPISLNRFLYANANPETLVDPDGHATLYCDTEASDRCHATQQKTAKKMAPTIHKHARLQEHFRWSRWSRSLAVHARGRGFDRSAKGGTDHGQRRLRDIARTAPDRDSPIAVAKGVAGAVGDFAVGIVTTPIYAATHLSEAAMGLQCFALDGCLQGAAHDLGIDHPIENLGRGADAFVHMSNQDKAAFATGVVLTAVTLRGGFRGGPRGDVRAPVQPYVRPSNATNVAQRASVQGRPCVVCGALTRSQRADHIDPLVYQHYVKGGIDLQAMHEVSAVQPMCPICSAREGGYLSWWSRMMRDQ